MKCSCNVKGHYPQFCRRKGVPTNEVKEEITEESTIFMEFIEDVQKSRRRFAPAARRQKVDEISIGLMKHKPVTNKWVPKKEYRTNSPSTDERLY